MYAPDIEQLYSMVEVKTPAHIMYITEKAGYNGDGRLYLESQAHMPGAQGRARIQSSPEEAINQATQGNTDGVDWQHVKRLTKQDTGIPTVVK
jgi:hypothetical protein